MKPDIDLFHQLVTTTPEGFVAITDYTDNPVNTHVYTPNGEWCGCTGASSKFTMLADIRHIVKSRIEYEQRIYSEDRSNIPAT